jgi:hypothetical protein
MSRRTDPELSYRTYKHYLLSIGYLLDNHYGVGRNQLASLSDAIEQCRAFQRLKAKAPRDTERVKSLIHIAWQTEITLRLPEIASGNASRPELSALCSHWGTIQLYYAIYTAAAAWLKATRGDSAPQNHATTLTVLADSLVDKGATPLPWGIACYSYKPPRFFGLESYQPNQISHLRPPSPQTSLDYLCLALKTTRGRDLDKHVSIWKQQHKTKSIPSEERQRIDDKCRPTTIFDFLWRLRYRVNYVDAALFLAGSKNKEGAARFHRSLCLIAHTSLLLFEKLLAKSWSRKAMYELANDFVTQWPYAEVTVSKRRTYW